MEAKNQIRKNYLEKRKKFSFLYKIKANKLIYKKVINYLKENNLKYIGIYLSTNFEVNTTKIIKYCFKNKISVFVPWLNLNTSEMDFKRISNLNKDLVFNNKWKVYEPKDILENIQIDKIDAIFIPLVCYDKQLNRIGMGKGYYDKFLSKLKQKNKKIGLAFKKQFYSLKINNNKFDIR